MDFIKNILRKVKNVDRKKLFAGIFAIILLVALPVTIFTVQNRQNIASQAGNPITVELQPASSDITVGQVKDVQVVLKAGSISVQSVEFALSYGETGQPDKVTAQFTPNPSSSFSALFTPPVEVNTSTKTVTYKTAVNIATTDITGDIVLGTLKLTGVSTGAVQVRFTGGAFNELSGELTPTFVNGSYTVVNPTVNVPTIETLPPTGSTPTTIMFNSRVNPKGKTVSVKYKYGTTDVPCQNFTSGRVQTIGPLTGTENIEPNPVSAGALSPNTPYYYCAVIYDSQSPHIPIYGNVVSFTTGSTPVPPTVTTLDTTGTTTKTLNASVNPNGHPGLTLVYRYGSTNASCVQLPNTITGPANLTGNTAISPNAVAYSGAITSGTVYYCASLISSDPLTQSVNVYSTAVKSFTLGSTGGTNTSADLSVVKSGPANATPGSNITYNITVGNTGPNTASQVRVMDTLPTGTRFVSASVTQAAGWTVTSKPSPGATGNVTFSKSSVTVGGTAILQLVVTVNDNTAIGTQITNTATISSITPAGSTQPPTPDPNTTNNSSTTTTTVTTTSITLTPTNSPVPPTNTPIPPNNTQARLELAVKLPGIGNNANGTKPSLGENNNPSAQRTFDILLFRQGVQVGSPIPTTFTYSPQEGGYKGQTLLSGIPLNVPYEIKIKTDNSLIKRVGFVDNFVPGQTTTLNANNSGNELVTGKISSTIPNTIGVQDYNDFMSCFKNQSSCTAAMKKKADFTDDGKLPNLDYNILISAFTNRQGD